MEASTIRHETKGVVVANIDETFLLDDATLAKHRVRRVPLGDNLVFLFDPNAKADSGLACTLLLEGENVDENILSRWMDISRHIYVRCPSNHIIRANSISASVLGGTTSPVQRLVFDTEGQVPISIGCDDPQLMIEVYFPFDVLRALSDDLGGDQPALIDVAF